MAKLPSIEALEARLTAALATETCVECAQRVGRCHTCGRPIGHSELDLQRARDHLIAQLDEQHATLLHLGVIPPNQDTPDD